LQQGTQTYFEIQGLISVPQTVHNSLYLTNMFYIINRNVQRNQNQQITDSSKALWMSPGETNSTKNKVRQHHIPPKRNRDMLHDMTEKTALANKKTAP